MNTTQIHRKTVASKPLTVACRRQPLTRALQAGGPDRRPKLTPQQRGELLAGCTDDIAVLEDVLGQSFADWRSVEGRGSFTERVSQAR